MTRNLLGRFAAVAALTVLGSSSLMGCKASASFGNEAKAPEAPAPTVTAAPTATATAEPTATATAEPNTKIKGDVKGSRVNIPGNIQYQTGKAVLKPESEPTLTQLKQFLDDNANVTLLRIEGHTDSDGDDNMNLKLSGNRAIAVVEWLVGKGISRDRLIAVGFGETKPAAPNDTAANKELNRRTEFHIAGLNNKNFLGRDPTSGGQVFKEAQK